MSERGPVLHADKRRALVLHRPHPTVEFMLPDLLLHHESLHIGQISIWRRAAGLPSVAFPSREPRQGLIKSR